LRIEKMAAWSTAAIGRRSMTFASSISNSSRIVLYFYSIVARARLQCQGAQPFPSMAQEGEI
jgi:hypothetical protein